MRVPWTARRSNQSILKEISPGCSLEGLLLKLKIQYFGHLMQIANSLEKTLMIEKPEEKGEQRIRQLDRNTYLEIMERREEPGLLQSMGSQTDTTERLSD